MIQSSARPPDPPAHHSFTGICSYSSPSQKIQISQRCSLRFHHHHQTSTPLDLINVDASLLPEGRLWAKGAHNDPIILEQTDTNDRLQPRHKDKTIRFRPPHHQPDCMFPQELLKYGLEREEDYEDLLVGSKKLTCSRNGGSVRHRCDDHGVGPGLLPLMMYTM
jgi:hypothetical protein